MKSTTPLVSIIIPVFNGENFVREAINSALSQTYKNIEIIVVNDGSTDNTEEVLKSYGDKITFYSKPNGGVSSALNYGIKKMHGEYFSWLSHDDLYFKDKVTAEIKYLTDNNLLHKKYIPYSDFALVDVKGKLISNVKFNHNYVNKKPELALLRGLVNGNSLLIPKSAFKTYGGFDTKLKCTQDYEKWFEFTKTYTFVHVPKILVKTRYHKNQVSNTSPLVPIEGNALYLKMIKSYSDEDKKRIDGNVYSYYVHLAEFLKYSPYDKAYQYCLDQIKKLPPETVTKDNYRYQEQKTNVYSDNKIVKFLQYIKYEGFKNTAKRILKKFKLLH